MFAHLRLSSLLLVVGLALAADAFAAERIWDNDLKRYLTEEETNHAEVFMTEEDAIKIMFPKSERIRKAVIRLSQEKKDSIEQRIGWKFPEESFEVHIGETGNTIDIDTSDAAVRARFAEAVAEEITARRRLLRRLAIDEIPVHTDGGVVDPLIKFFRARETRARRR